jgi:hypothetical protein
LSKRSPGKTGSREIEGSGSFFIIAQLRVTLISSKSAASSDLTIFPETPTPEGSITSHYHHTEDQASNTGSFGGHADYIQTLAAPCVVECRVVYQSPRSKIKPDPLC